MLVELLLTFESFSPLKIALATALTTTSRFLKAENREVGREREEMTKCDFSS